MLMTSINTTTQGMHEIAQQASILATGLQNAAPPGTSLQSVQYLVDVATSLEKACLDIKELSQAGANELEEKLYQRMQDAVNHEEALRKQYEIVDKFRFIRERLQGIFQYLQQEIHESTRHLQQEAKKNQLQEDEVEVYVYLYNAHGALLSSWQNLLMPKVFYEYSVNRPIYKEKPHIQMLVRGKKDKMQHAFITVAVKSAHITQSSNELKDSLGNPLIKIKEGSLAIDKLISFTFNEQDYVLNVKGELVKKD